MTQGRKGGRRDKTDSSVLDATLAASEANDASIGQEANENVIPRLVLDLEGFEGPIDLLLTLARDQKVDLTHISILQLVDQYINFIAAARQLRIEIAADYLVMAAWLAFLKSRLLLPEPESEDAQEPDGAELAAALAFQLRRLEAMRESGARLMSRPRLGRDYLPRGAPEGVTVLRKSVFEATYYDLLRAYADHKRRVEGGTLRIEPVNLYSLEDALQRLTELLGQMPDWTTLSCFLLPSAAGTLLRCSAIAATFAATLELAKAGQIEIRQSGPFTPIYIRRTNHADGSNR
ncbi:segregation and condensation protein A [Azospirillaceae bacterium]